MVPSSARVRFYTILWVFAMAWPWRSAWPAGPAARSCRTRHPVVLVPGIMGFRAIRVGPVNFGDYFRGVVPHLRSRGVEVRSVSIGMTNGVADRARRLKAALDRLHPTGKINLVAHSLGGLDCRYMITHLGMGPRVASLTTIGTPHRGSPVADWFHRSIGMGLGVEWFLERLGIPVGAFGNLTTEWCARFNRVTPDHPGVRYFSIAGRQAWYKIAPPLIPFHWMLKLGARIRAGRGIDPVSRGLLMSRAWGRSLMPSLALEEESVARHGVDPRALRLYRRTGGANDGLVPIESAAHGEEFRVVEMDHWDQIGWLTFRRVPRFYEAIARHLTSRGL